jgi:hypothetical protein
MAPCTNKRNLHNTPGQRRDDVDLQWLRDELAIAWRAAQQEAVDAYHAWSASRGAHAYAAYRTAQDRADRAQDELADECRRVA